MIALRARANPYNNITPASIHNLNRLQTILLSSYLTLRPTSILQGTKNIYVSTVASINDNKKIAHHHPTNVPTNHSTRMRKIPPAGTTDKNTDNDNDDNSQLRSASGMNMVKDDVIT